MNVSKKSYSQHVGNNSLNIIKPIRNYPSVPRISTFSLQKPCNTRYFNLKNYTFYRERKLYLQSKTVINIPSNQMPKLDPEILPHLNSQEETI